MVTLPNHHQVIALFLNNHRAAPNAAVPRNSTSEQRPGSSTRGVIERSFVLRVVIMRPGRRSIQMHPWPRELDSLIPIAMSYNHAVSRIGDLLEIPRPIPV